MWLAFLAGAVSTGFVVAACFFARFWARTRDALFLAFAAAFLLMALNQTLVAWMGDQAEHESLVYLPRLAAFVLIAAAILWKNFTARGR